LCYNNVSQIRHGGNSGVKNPRIHRYDHLVSQFSAIYRNVLSPHELSGGPSDIKSLSEAFDHGLKTTGSNAPCLGHRPFTEQLSKDGTVIKTWASNYVWQSYGQVQERRLTFGSGLVSLFEQLGIKQTQDKIRTFGLYGVTKQEN
jgi:hypothetical protein